MSSIFEWIGFISTICIVLVAIYTVLDTVIRRRNGQWRKPPNGEPQPREATGKTDEGSTDHPALLSIIPFRDKDGRPGLLFVIAWPDERPSEENTHAPPAEDGTTTRTPNDRSWLN